MSLILDAIFSSVAFSHLIVDVLNGQRAILLAYLSGPLELSNTLIAMVSTSYVVSAALIQPVFGFIADRWGSRWLVAGGVLWMAVFFSLAVVIPGQAALVMLILASLGSGAYHPAGVMQATMRGRTYYAGRETTAASYFFLFGQLGYFFGPMLGGPLLGRFGPAGLLALAAPALPIGLYAARRLSSPLSGALRLAGPAIAPPGVVRLGSATLLAFALLAAFQSWAQANMITFVPKYLSDLGFPPGSYGLASALFMGGSALGNVAGGSLSDRFGKRRVAFCALLLASLPLYLVPEAGLSAWLFLILPLGGALTGATHSIIVVRAQRLIPGGMALASGLILGFMFSSGAVGTLLTGRLADQWGFTPVFHVNGLLALAAAGLAITLRD